MQHEARSGPGGAAEETRVVQAGELRSARVESLRALAAIGVMLAHAYAAANLWSAAAPAGTVTTLFYGGTFGVFLFFALSGYLLFWPFARRDFGGGGAIDLRRYAVNRALRILPLYYISVAIVLIVQKDGGTLREWVVFAVFGESFSVDTIASVNGALWSLVVEVHFYLLLPLLALVLGRLAGGSPARGALLLGLLALASIALRYRTVPAEPNTELLWRFSFPTTFFFFVSGMLVALLRIVWERRRPAWLRGVLGSSSAWLLASVPIWITQFFHEDWFVLAAVASFLMVGACVLPLAPGRVVRALEWRPLAAVGIASYSLYVWHIPILQQIAGPLDAPRGPYDDLGFIAGIVPLCLLAAFVSYRFVEAPFLALRRRWSPASA